MPYQTRLPEALANRGLVVELVPGWETRGSSSFAPKGAVCHWTAGPRGTTRRPSLNICTHGRTGLPGPLCNVYLDRNGIAVVVAAGRANHAGVGGWRGLAGNSSVFGTEAECGGDGDWTPAQRIAYPKINAAFADLGGFTEEMVCGHNEWAPTRKIDIRDWPMSAMRTEVGKILRGEAQKEVPEDMFLIAKNNNGPDVWVGNGVTRALVNNPTTLDDLKYVAQQAGQRVTDLGEVANLNAIGVPVVNLEDVKRLVDEAVAKVGTLPPADVQKITEQVATGLATKLTS